MPFMSFYINMQDLSFVLGTLYFVFRSNQAQRTKYKAQSN